MYRINRKRKSVKKIVIGNHFKVGDIVIDKIYTPYHEASLTGCVIVKVEKCGGPCSQRDECSGQIASLISETFDWLGDGWCIGNSTMFKISHVKDIKEE